MQLGLNRASDLVEDKTAFLLLIFFVYNCGNSSTTGEIIHISFIDDEETNRLVLDLVSTPPSGTSQLQGSHSTMQQNPFLDSQNLSDKPYLWNFSRTWKKISVEPVLFPSIEAGWILSICHGSRILI